MANAIGLGANPIRVDTAATIVTSANPIQVQAMQWVDDDAAAGGVIAAGENLIMTVNGTTVQINATVAYGMVWNLTLCRPITVNDLIVSTIDGGTLLIWKV